MLCVGSRVRFSGAYYSACSNPCGAAASAAPDARGTLAEFTGGSVISGMPMARVRWDTFNHWVPESVRVDWLEPIPGEPARTPARVSLRRVRLNTGGYDFSGCYWGTGAPLWEATCDDWASAYHVRASDREDARGAVLEKHPRARFYR
jgi:hypothetical protein